MQLSVNVKIVGVPFSRSKEGKKRDPGNEVGACMINIDHNILCVDISEIKP